MDSEYSVRDIQEYINKLISWYNIKFSNHYLESALSNGKKVDSSLLKIMNLETLKKSYSVFEHELFKESKSSNEKIILQKHLIISAGWGLIYNKKSTPEFGYYRACQLLNDFNGMFGWNLSPVIYKEVLDMDYSLDNNVVVEKLKEKRNEKLKKENTGRFYKVKMYIKKELFKKEY